MLLTVKNLSKKIKNKEVLSNISFQIASGEVVGIIGSNGAGKTTLFNILIGSIGADSGEVNFSKNVRVDYAMARSEFFGDMTVEDNLKWQCVLRQVAMPKLDSEKNPFKIDFYNSPYSSLSAGMKQKVLLTSLFLFQSDLLFLDEPINHLDIDSIFVLREKILSLKTEGVSFFVSSHGFDELEKMCDRVLFIKNGKILVSEHTQILLEKYGDLESAYKSVLKNLIR